MSKEKLKVKLLHKLKKVNNIKKVSFYDKNDNPIIIQRYNRPRILIAMKKEKKKDLKQDTAILNK